MPKYAVIENERKNGNKYVSYDYNKIHPDMPDEFNPEYNWCKYWIVGINGGPSRFDVYSKNLASHDYYKCEKGKLNFKAAEDIIRQKTRQLKLNTETIVGYFKSLTTINDKSNPNCKLMLYAGAKINWESVINDISSAHTANDMSRVLQSLTAEVNAAALNGAFSKLFDVANERGKNAKTPNSADKNIEDKITRLYNKTMHGDYNSPAIEIPTDPSTIFATPGKISEELDKLKNKSNLSPNEVVKEIIDPCEKIINKGLYATNKGKPHNR